MLPNCLVEIFLEADPITRQTRVAEGAVVKKPVGIERRFLVEDVLHAQRDFSTRKQAPTRGTGAHPSVKPIGCESVVIDLAGNMIAALVHVHGVGGIYPVRI